MLRPPPIVASLLEVNAATWTCRACRRSSQWQNSRNLSTKPSASPNKPQAPPLPSLSRPLGVDAPPKPGDNSARDTRPWHERREDYWDREKHAERRRKIIKEFSTPYFRDFSRMRYHDGKTFIAPDRLLKAEAAKYLPNMQGYTYANSWRYQDTTPILKGKTSIVTFASARWALDQVHSFIGKKENPGLVPVMEEFESRGLQRVSVSVERDLLRAIIVRLCLPYARRYVSNKEEWARTFVMRKGVDRDLLESFGMLNMQVGHVFLVDRNCKIRWAGNGFASDEERRSLVRLVQRLMETNRDEGKILNNPSTARMKLTAASAL